MNKLIRVLLCLALALFFFGCSSDKPQETTSGNTEPATTPTETAVPPEVLQPERDSTFREIAFTIPEGWLEATRSEAAIVLKNPDALDATRIRILSESSVDATQFREEDYVIYCRDYIASQWKSKTYSNVTGYFDCDGIFIVFALLSTPEDPSLGFYSTQFMGVACFIYNDRVYYITYSYTPEETVANPLVGIAATVRPKGAALPTVVSKDLPYDPTA